MARTKTNTNTHTNTETPKKENKKIKVIFKRCVISDYGTFDSGAVAELEERIANKMINGGYAEKC